MIMATTIRRTAKWMYNALSVFKEPPLVPLGHYYSPLTNAADRARAATWAASNEAPVGVQLDLEAMARLAGVLAPMWAELPRQSRYKRDLMYELADAAVYHSMLRHFRPAQILEVGSGYSTAVALDTIESHDLPSAISCVEPNPERLHRLLRANDSVTLHPRFVQDMPLSTFDRLGSGDFLFIDSTHVVKAGSDVVWTTLRVLPRLATGVIVHIHDIFWPLEYQENWLRGRRDWNEAYLIHAFLSGNSEWRVLFFNDQVWQAQRDLVRANLPETAAQRPGGLWLQKVT
jgi:predicted O-methyltransferase YrrM